MLFLDWGEGRERQPAGHGSRDGTQRPPGSAVSSSLGHRGPATRPRRDRQPPMWGHGGDEDAVTSGGGGGVLPSLAGASLPARPLDLLFFFLSPLLHRDPHTRRAPLSAANVFVGDAQSSAVPSSWWMRRQAVVLRHMRRAAQGPAGPACTRWLAGAEQNVARLARRAGRLLRGVPCRLSLSTWCGHVDTIRIQASDHTTTGMGSSPRTLGRRVYAACCRRRRHTHTHIYAHRSPNSGFTHPFARLPLGWGKWGGGARRPETKRQPRQQRQQGCSRHQATQHARPAHVIRVHCTDALRACMHACVLACLPCPALPCLPA